MDKPIFLSAFCVNFTDYDKLASFIDGFTDFPVGVEFGTWWQRVPELPELVDAVTPVFKKYPASIHSPFYDICYPEGSEERKKQTEVFDRACRQFKALNATSMVVHTHEAAQSDLKVGRELSLSRLLETYELLKSYGIPMTVENVGYPQHGNVLFDEQEFIALFDKLPEEIGCLIDTGHAMLNRWDIVGLIERLGGRIRGYHLNNNNGVGDSHYPCFDTRGFYDAGQMEAVIAAAARYSPAAELIVEYAPGPHITKELMHGEICRIMDIYNKNRG